MNFQGRIVHCRAAEEKITVEQAVVTEDRISIDWSQDGRPGYLIAKSTGGTQFQGRYGHRQEESDYECELTLFKSDHEVLLFGTWRDQNSARKGTLVVRLPARAIESDPQESGRLSARETAVERGTTVIAASAKLSAKISSATPTESAPAHAADTATSAAAVLPTAGPATPPLSSRQIDHLLSITAEQFAERDRIEIEQELAAAPVSALFKLAHNALAADLRALAAQMFAERYRAEPLSTRPAVPTRQKESPELRAQKRRSSRHGRSRESGGS
jgi:hypothetical protein